MTKKKYTADEAIKDLKRAKNMRAEADKVERKAKKALEELSGGEIDFTPPAAPVIIDRDRWVPRSDDPFNPYYPETFPPRYPLTWATNSYDVPMLKAEGVLS